MMDPAEQRRQRCASAQRGWERRFRNGPAVLYRIYDTDTADLLWVGVTMNLRQRLAAHARTSWWPRSPYVGHVDYADRASAETDERYAIAVESPRYNVAHNRKVVAA